MWKNLIHTTQPQSQKGSQAILKDFVTAKHYFISSWRHLAKTRHIEEQGSYGNPQSTNVERQGIKAQAQKQPTFSFAVQSRPVSESKLLLRIELSGQCQYIEMGNKIFLEDLLRLSVLCSSVLFFSLFSFLLSRLTHE